VASYCTAAQIKQIAGIAAEDDDTNRTALLTDMLVRIDALIEQSLGTWFFNLAKTYYVEAPHERCERIWFPAPIITVSSITVRGLALDLTSDCILEKAIGAIKRPAGVYWDTGMYDDEVQVHYPTKVVGTFGYAAVPKDVELVAADMGAILGGLKKKTFTTG
jgi:hypothetical protein